MGEILIKCDVHVCGGILINVNYLERIMEVKWNGRSIVFVVRMNPWKNLSQSVTESDKFYFIQRNGGMIATVLIFRHEALYISAAIVLGKVRRSLMISKYQFFLLLRR